MSLYVTVVMSLYVTSLLLTLYFYQDFGKNTARYCTVCYSTRTVQYEYRTVAPGGYWVRYGTSTRRSPAGNDCSHPEYERSRNPQNASHTVHQYSYRARVLIPYYFNQYTGAGALLRNHIEETALPIERTFITDLYRIYH